MKRILNRPHKQLMILMVTALLLACGSCDDFVEVEQPASQLTSTAVFNDKATANAALSSIYARLRDSGMLTGGRSGISTNMGAYSDELEYYGLPSNPTRNFYINAIAPNTPEVLGWWSNAYNQIYAANAIIEGLAVSEGLTQQDKDQFTGEALFIRSLYHFYLANLYGDIPYITTTDYRVNTVVTRMPLATLYESIVTDLELAFSLLPEDYIYPERIRPNKAVAMALLARVNLCSEKWAEAGSAASYILDNEAQYPWPPDISTVFLKGSPTTIWQLVPAQPGMNTFEGENFIFDPGPPNHTALSATLVQGFEPGDMRKEYWVALITDGTSVWYQANKYKERGPTSSSVEYSIQMRLSEQYLIRAEARARLGDLSGAAQDLDRVRNAAGLADTSANTMEGLLQAILQERNVELFTEGHRFFDLKRTGKLDAALNGKPGWEPTDRMLPIPESELIKNPNLSPQNPGY